MAGVLFFKSAILTDLERLPAVCLERFIIAKTSFIKKSEELQLVNKDRTQFVLKGADFRKEIEAIDYLLSFPVSINTRSTFIDIIRHLGYVGLAAVISGEASKSPAKVYFKDGRVFLEGTSCKAGWRKMRMLPDIRFPRYRGSKDPYSAPASSVEEFLTIVTEHWPLYEGELSSVMKEAKRWLKKKHHKKNSSEEEPTVSTAVAKALTVDPKNPQGSVAWIRLRSEDFLLGFTWDNNVDVWSMLGQIKEIPYKSRKFNPGSKEWNFPTQYLGRVQNIVAKFYPKLVIMDGEVEETPKNLWRKR